jgi:hypothetical protein
MHRHLLGVFVFEQATVEQIEVIPVARKLWQPMCVSNPAFFARRTSSSWNWMIFGRVSGWFQPSTMMVDPRRRQGPPLPLFRTARGKTGELTGDPMQRVDAYRIVRRRPAEAGFKQKLGYHVFRATGITAYLEAGGTLENARAMAEEPVAKHVRLGVIDVSVCEAAEGSTGSCTPQGY